MNLYIIIAMIGVLALCLLAMIFQSWLNMPPDVLKFLQSAIVPPVLAALLTAWRNIAPETETVKTINVIHESTGSTAKADINI